MFPSCHHRMNSVLQTRADSTSDTIVSPRAGLPGPMPPPRVCPLEKFAFFFDLDGTLAPIAATPDAAAIPPHTLDLLKRLYDACAGAVAIVSGRTAERIDAMTSPFRWPLAGLHGAQWRGSDGTLDEPFVPVEPVAALHRALVRLATRHPGSLVEHKRFSVAIHFRTAPEHETAILAATQELAAEFADVFTLQPGKMVVEFKPKGANKGEALERFLHDPVFAGRTPVMAGDDDTDECAFGVTNRLQGISIRIGPGPTKARYCLGSPQALARWLNAVLDAGEAGPHDQAAVRHNHGSWTDSASVGSCPADQLGG